MYQPKDIIVVGGGMIGAATALGLAKIGLNVHIIERNALPHFSPLQPYDIRISAISAGSVKLLKDLGAWHNIQNMRVHPYAQLATWEKEGYAIHFDCKELQLNELGFMVENNLIQIGLWKEFSHYNNLSNEHDTQLQEANFDGHYWYLTLKNGQSYKTPLIVAADGANSHFRQLANIGITGWHYRQACLLILVNIADNHPDTFTTWQQFYPTGPRAFLPLSAGKACLVWYDHPDTIKKLTNLTKPSLNNEIHNAFPQRLGKVESIHSASFPLIRRHAQRYFNKNVVLLGDSAHTINPLAGQGVNLGFKDVSAFLNIAADTSKKGFDIHSEQTLTQYEHQRKMDNLIMQTGMDLFYKGFKEEILPLKIARNLALKGIQKTSIIKKQALKYALGL